MSEHFLDAHDFGAVLEQVRGETVAQYVRACLAFPADFPQQVVDVVAQCAESKRFAIFAQEYKARGAWGVSCIDLCRPEFFEPGNERICNGDDALLISFTDHAGEFFLYL